MTADHLMNDTLWQVCLFFAGSSIQLKDMHNKIPKRSRKRSRNSSAPQPQPIPPGETLRGLLTEFHELSYSLPESTETWNIINSVDSLLKQAKSMIESNNSVVTVTNRHNNTTAEHQNKSTVKSHKRTDVHESVWEAQPAKMVCNNMTMSSNSGLGQIVQAVDQISRVQHDLLTDHQTNNLSTHSYVNPTQQLLTPTLVQTQHPQANILSQQSVVTPTPHHLPTSSATTHSLLGMNPSSNLSLQVAGMLTDGYHLHSSNAISSMYGQLPAQQQRHYLDLHQPESQSFAQQMAKIASE